MSLLASTGLRQITGVWPTRRHLLGSIRSYVIPPFMRSRRSTKPRLANSRKRINLNVHKISHPTMDVAMYMPHSPHEMDNASLVTLGALGDSDAREEILKRHIMVVDRVDYQQACETFKTMELKNAELNGFLAFPFRLGITVAISAGIIAIPMVFDLNVAMWFNEAYVTADVPTEKDLETWLEVGSWTWNWMEPPLGTISFTLLAFQFAKDQIQNLGLKPYTESIKSWKAQRLANAFPRYNKNVVIAYSESTHIFLTPNK